MRAAQPSRVAWSGVKLEMKLRVCSCSFSGVVFSTHSRCAFTALCADNSPASTGLNTGFAILREFRGAEQRKGVFDEGFEPKFFRSLVGQVIIGMILGETFGVARADPVGDFVNGAVVAFRIAEAFGYERTIAVLGVPAGGQFAQGETKALGGEIGSAGFADDKKTAQLHDEFEALRAGDRIPADHSIPILEMSCGGTPDEHGDDLILLEDELAKPISRLASGTEKVLFVKHSVGKLPVGGSLGGANVE